jgi:hypothetical protein
MSSPIDLSEFQQEILDSEEVRQLVWKELGEKKAPKKWKSFQKGEELDDLYTLLVDNKWSTGIGEMVDAINGAAPDNDTFQIEIWRLVSAYWIRANEFDDIGYFRTQEEAYDYASMEFSSFIDELNERQQDEEEDDGWEKIASADDDVSQELLEWAGLDKIWDKYYLGEFERFQDLAKRSDHLIIEGEEWGGDTPGLSGVWQTAKTDNGEALKEELRNLIVELIWENRKQIHQYRKEFGNKG